MSFYGRIEEVEILDSFLNSNELKTLLILGREGIGKTSLIINSIKNRNDCYYTKYRNVNLDDITSLNDNINTLILDDVSNINKAMELYNSLGNPNFKLIVATKGLDADKELFDFVIYLKSQSYSDSSLYYSGYSDRDKKLLYKVFGGEPKLNSKVNPKVSALENIYNIAIKGGDYLELYLNSLFNTYFHKSLSVLNVLRSLSQGVSRLSLIAKEANMSTERTRATLNKLIKLDFVEKLVDLEDPNNHKKNRYKLVSNYLLFYFKYIYPNISIREMLNEDEFYNKYIKVEFEYNII